MTAGKKSSKIFARFHSITNDREIKQISPEPTFIDREDIGESLTGGCKVGHWFNKFPYLGFAITFLFLS